MKILSTFIILTTVCILSFVNISSVFADEQTTKEEQAPKKIVKLLPDDFKPAFTRETVIKLNAIVRRSYDVINEFDAISKKLKKATLSAEETSQSSDLKRIAQQQASEMDALDKRSKSALKDMMAAVEILKNSNEYYNAAVLAGMVTFVKTVEEEVAKQNSHIDEILKNV